MHVIYLQTCCIFSEWTSIANNFWVLANIDKDKAQMYSVACVLPVRGSLGLK